MAPKVIHCTEGEGHGTKGDTLYCGHREKDMAPKVIHCTEGEGHGTKGDTLY